MYEKFLSAAGLKQQQAIVFETLLNEGELTASEIYKKTPYKRGLVYKILEELVKKQLIIKLEAPNQVATFKTEHPYKVVEMIEKRQRQLEYYKKSMDELMPQLLSSYNLANNKPGIKFYEGVEGIKKVLEDTLTAENLIYTYADIETIEKYTPKINADYRKKRNRLKIKKRVLVLDSPFSRKFMDNYDTESIEVRFIDHEKYHFTSTLQIYDNKVAYISMSKKSCIALLISDRNIYQMHKSLFEFHWTKAVKNDQLPDFSRAQ